MLCRQSRSEALPLRSRVLLPHPSQCPLPPLLWLGPMGGAARPPMLQSSGPFISVSPPEPLCLPIADKQHPRGVRHFRLSAFHPSQNAHSSQLALAHQCPSQPATSFGGLQVRGHF